MVQVVLPNDTNLLGNLLGGTLMHWIDLVGAIAAGRHARKLIVTASMEGLDFHSPVRLGSLVILKARVVYAGRTSMQVGVQVYSEEGATGKRERTSDAMLTYVAVDPDGRPSPVPPLLLRTEEEGRLAQEAKARREARLERLKRMERSR